MNALVVFHGHGHGPLSRLFGARGFRHCFVCVRRGGYWVRIDSQDGTPIIEMVCAGTFDLAGFYEKQGFNVAQTRVHRGGRVSPFVFATCVGVAKRIIGVRAPWVVTPAQLYRHLTKTA